MKFAPNFPLMMFSLVISISLWLVVFARDNTGPEGIWVNVDYSVLDKEKWHLDTDDASANPQRVRLKFTGGQDRLEDIKNSPPEVVVDLTSPKEGAFRYPAHLSQANYDQLLVGGTQITIKVKLEPVIPKDVPVEIAQKGALKDPLMAVDSLNAAPMRVTVTGPRSLVNRIVKCRGYVDLNDVTSADVAPRGISLQAMDNTNEAVDVRINPPMVTVTPILTAHPTTRTALVDLLPVGQVAVGYTGTYKIDPPAVVLSGNPSLLGGISSINTEPVDITGLTTDRDFRVKLRVPLHIQLKSRPYVTVHYQVRPKPSYHPDGSPPPTSPGTDDFPATVPPLSGSRRGGN